MCVLYPILQKVFYNNNIRTISELNGYSIIPSDARTIHLYHFLFEKPFVASKNCNHFGFLQKVDIALELFSDNVYDGAKTNIDEGYGDIVAGLKSKKQATLFEAYRVPKKMKKDYLKKLSKNDTKRQVKRYKDEVIVNYVLAMKGNSQEVKRLESL